MPQIAVKLFRTLQDAEEALAELQSYGYQAEEFGILAMEKTDGKEFAKDIPHARVVSLPGLGKVIAAGKIASAIHITEGKEARSLLSELWGISEETFDYYQQGLSLGGAVVSVHTDGPSLAKAKEILRTTSGSKIETAPVSTSSPAFAKGKRMSSTAP